MPAFTSTTSATRTGSRGGVVVEGLDATVSMFTRKAVEVPAAAGLVAVAHARKAAQRMRDKVAYDEGDVFDSITSDDKPTTTAFGVYADAGPDPQANEAAFVARFLEHGTVKMGPQPFVGPAADETFPEFVRAVKAVT